MVSHAAARLTNTNLPNLLAEPSTAPILTQSPGSALSDVGTVTSGSMKL